MLEVYKYDIESKETLLENFTIISLYFKPEHLSSKIDRDLTNHFKRIDLKPFKNDYKYVIKTKTLDDDMSKTLSRMINNTNDLVVYSCYTDFYGTWATAWIKFLKMK